jgi:hypothetical protein
LRAIKQDSIDEFYRDDRVDASEAEINLVVQFDIPANC